MSQNTILVIGATGKTGRRVTARLRLLGEQVRPVSRSSAIPFDWSDPRTWDAALDGASSAYLVPPVEIGPIDHFIDRAQSVGVRRVALLSGRAADSWGDSAFGLDMRAAERAVHASSLDWTIVRSSNFSQNFSEEVLLEPLLRGELAAPPGEVPEPFVDIEDVAAVAAQVLTTPGHEGQTYELTGPRGITFGEAVGLIAAASGRTITYRQITPGQYAQSLTEQGLTREEADTIAEMYVLMERGLISETTDDVHRLLGRPAATFEDYVIRTAADGRWPA
ncbi:uncharacterized protein YbjT (DUF2867 family) [Williamsia limnetica]|uniref:Uncharacterized protein YbjT (DUF2867 family) n=1 Tax=Williamsia limnetica TaxID=882452 RepID=A0A318RFR9_WILLI|nr:NAD(P)H-binding protein [Williamsia limnetica]PYE11978.1 uncharacterized protein YbjT (DUF2867 family) [Williamsia limnetica]